MTETKLGLYKKAASFLATTPPASLSETTEVRVKLDNVYDDALLACLEMGNWKFAIKSALYEPDGDIDPGFGYQHVYPIMSDFVRLVAISSDERFKTEISDYQEENGYWYTDEPQLYLRWVSSHTSYGTNVGLFPANYARVVACYMAIESGLPILKSRGERNDLIAEFQNIILPRAKRLDAIDEPIKRRPAGSWSTSRFRNQAQRTYVRGGKIGGF